MENVISEINKEFNYQIEEYKNNKEDIAKLSDIINQSSNNIYFCGIGKSGNMAKHCSDLLKSINYPSFYLELINLNHGDIGTLKINDIIIIFSNSGNTNELLNLIPLFKNKNVKTIGICNNKDSKFNLVCDITFTLPFKNEISGDIDKIPTNSVMSQLIFINILVSFLKKNIDVNKYKLNHLGGDIGRRLLKIKDCLILDYPKIIIDKSSISLTSIFLEMTTKRIGCCFFEKKKKNLFGILTDGDIRKLLIKKPNLNYIELNDINTNFSYESDTNKYMNDCLNQRYIPILENKNIIGIIVNNYKHGKILK